MPDQIFQKEVLPLKAKLYRLSLHVLENEEDAKDVLQDALIKLWDQRAKLVALESVEAWCMRVVRNLSLDKIKSRKYRMTSDVTEIQERIPTLKSTPLEHAEQMELRKRIHELVMQLPERFRRIFELRDMDGLSYQEIAEVLDIEVSEVKTNLHRARKQLREQLTKMQLYGV
jgi:RNA polymerase sigma-70 factor (family 1)